MNIVQPQHYSMRQNTRSSGLLDKSCVCFQIATNYSIWKKYDSAYISVDSTAQAAAHGEHSVAHQCVAAVEQCRTPQALVIIDDALVNRTDGENDQ